MCSLLSRSVMMTYVFELLRANVEYCTNQSSHFIWGSYHLGRDVHNKFLECMQALSQNFKGLVDIRPLWWATVPVSIPVSVTRKRYAYFLRRFLLVMVCLSVDMCARGGG